MAIIKDGARIARPKSLWILCLFSLWSFFGFCLAVAN